MISQVFDVFQPSPSALTRCHLSRRERQLRLFGKAAANLQLPALKMRRLPLWSNDDDHRQWRIEEGVVGAVASKMRVQLHEAAAGSHNPELANEVSLRGLFNFQRLCYNNCQNGFLGPSAGLFTK